MWSGPRNLSSALMRSFGERADCTARDEPFYGPYLVLTGIDHPMREEILARVPTDWRAVARACAAGPVPTPVEYQKHMTHHMLPAIALDWMEGLTHAFLIRSPERVLASYAQKREEPGAADIGFDRQAGLFARVADRLGHAPPVVEAEDIRAAPEAMLRALCAALGLGFDPAMLGWAPGPRPHDGVWGRHWYDGLWRSTGFAPPDPPPAALPAPLARLAEAVRPAYEALRRHRISPQPSGR